MIQLDYSKMSYDELIQTIKDVQKELFEQRGTTTHCFNIWNNGTKKVVYLDGYKQKDVK